VSRASGLFVAIALPFLAWRQDAPPPKPAAAPAAKPEAAPPAAPQPSLVLVTLDTLRADHLGCYGYARPTSPKLDLLAKESLLFQNCYSAFPHTTQSHCSILTGVYPIEHGLTTSMSRGPRTGRESRCFVSTPQLASVAQIVQRHGWHTGGFVSAAPVKRVTGMSVGFDAWDEPDAELRVGAKTLAVALPWLEKVEEPFFLWVHLFDAHAPPRGGNDKYVDLFPHDETLVKHLHEIGVEDRGIVDPQDPDHEVPVSKMFAQYDAGVRVLDDEVARIVAALQQKGVWPRTTLVVVGDHGEGLGQHGSFTHGFVWREQLNVPLLVRVPGVAARKVDAVVSTIDALPTALALTPGLPADELLAQARGRNVVADDFEERPVFGQSATRVDEFALTTSRWRLVKRGNTPPALYDLSKDPHETTDVAAQNAKVADLLGKQLKQLLDEQHARRKYYQRGGVAPTTSSDEDARRRAELEKLGYTEKDESGKDEGDGE
jgi:arylsulfatase